MNLLEVFKVSFDFLKGIPPVKTVEIVTPEAASLERQVSGQVPSVALATLSEQQVYEMFLNVFVGGNSPPVVEIRKKDEARLQTLEAFVRDVFSPHYLLGDVGVVSHWSTLPDEERAVLAHIREARDYLKMPNGNGVRNFFMAIYRAEIQGLGMQPPIVAHTRFRPNIVWPIRQDMFGGGLSLVRKIVRYDDANWENAAAEQLLLIHGLAQRYGVQLQQIVHQDFFDAVAFFRDMTRRRVDFLRAEAAGLPEEQQRSKLARAGELEQVYFLTSAQLQMPLPLRDLRLGPSNAKWQ